LLLLVPALIIIWLQQPDDIDWRLELAANSTAEPGTTPMFRSDFASVATDLFVHAASVTELNDGRLLTVWFGGSREGASDVNIYGAYFDPASQQWGENQVLASRSSTHQATGRTIRKLGNPVVSQAPDGKDLAKIYPGQVIAFQAAADGSLQGIRLVRSPLETAHYWRGDGGFNSRIETRTPDLRESWAVGEIESSLFLAGQEAGLSHNLIMEMANIFGGVIDFVLDPRVGDTLHLIYEEQFLDGEKYRDGDIVAASFTNQGETYNAYRYRDANGDLGYFNEEGVSMRKAFLLAPVDFTRISSNFNLRRLHPIYKTTRPHRGTDYAAPTGTPVFAAGDGRVVRAGYTRANGNYVVIQHGEQYQTKYLHLHKRRVKQGQRVSQSQVIGTVGATGAATGPHLHYEFLMNGVHRNPRTIHKKLPKAKSLPEAEMPRFRQAIRETSVQLASLRSGSQLALANAAGEQQQ
jgi:murein DD-endopeptidase MepM/ murein hydrolase activator NlpD